MKLVSVGTVAFDAIETPFGKTDKIVGGACTYISLSASYFNNNPKIISVVGDDFPKETIDLLHSKNIDTEGLQIKEGEKTFFWSGKYHQDMNSRDTIDTQLNVLETFELYGCYCESANYNSLAYSNSTDPVSVTLAIRYDNAIQSPQGTGIGTAIGRTVNTAVTGGGA